MLIRQCSTSVLTVILCSSYVLAGTWQTFDIPGEKSTELTGIDGDNIVGTTEDGGAFIYNGSKWTSYSVPVATKTVANGINGNYIIGQYQQGVLGTLGFLYDGINWYNISHPSGIPMEYATYAEDMSGDYVVGQYIDTSDKIKGFIYNRNSYKYSSLIYGSLLTSPQGISGDNIVGYYENSSGLPLYQGFLYNMTSKHWTTLNYPEAINTYVEDISGNYIVGSFNYSSDHRQGFLYNGSTWTTLNYPEAYATYVTGISGNKIIGYYAASNVHGFIYTIPEPATLLLFGLGAMIIRKRKV
jgi:hypothetical protein